MPGLVGLVTNMPPERAKRELAAMVDAQRHESFFVSGTWCDESLGVYVGWTAHQEAFDSRMPINEDGQVVLVFSGEEFGDRGNGGGPSYLVRLYEQAPTFPRELNGQFHGLVVDRRDGTVVLFNDRYGMRRVYYHESNMGFYFGAEAKALLAVRPELRKLDSQSFGELVACGCVLGNRSLFKGIQLLPAGSAWTIHGGSIQQRRTYFQPAEWEEQTPLEPEPYYEELRHVVARNLPRYFNGHDRIGVALTGGLDTRLIMAWQKPAPNSLACYTFGSALRETQDVRIAQQVSEVCRQPHQTIATGTEFLARFPHYAERCIYVSDGCGDLAHSPDLYVSEKARQVAPVKVVGTYSSEVLSPVPTFKPIRPVEGLFRQELLDDVYRAEQTYSDMRQVHPVTFAAFRQSPWWHYGVLALEQTQLTVRSPFLDNDFIRTVYRAPTPSHDVRQQLIGDGSPALAAIRTDRGIGGNAGPLTGALSRALLNFTYKAEYAYDYGMPQWLARIDHFLSPLCLERMFLGRHKMFHFRVWYRGALAPYVRDLLLDSRTLSRPYLEPRTVEAIVSGHLKGDRNYTAAIHKLLSLELIHRLFVDVR